MHTNTYCQNKYSGLKIITSNSPVAKVSVAGEHTPKKKKKTFLSLSFPKYDMFF